MSDADGSTTMRGRFYRVAAQLLDEDPRTAVVLGRRHLPKNLGPPGALQGQLRIVAGNVARVRAKRGVVLRDPAVVRIGIGGIDADQIMPAAQLVYNAIVHRASLGEHEGSVLCLAELEARHVVGSDILQQRKRLRATMPTHRRPAAV